MPKNHRMYLGGEWIDRRNRLDITCPYDDSLVGRAPLATRDDFAEAITRAQAAFQITRDLPCYRREAVCRQIADDLERKQEAFALAMARELGKALKDARGEVARAVNVFRVSAEEAKRVGGEIVDLDWTPGSDNRLGLVRRFPIGVVAGITPFNFPLNLLAHKIGPAIAGGNTIVVKPASKTPLIALMLAELVDKTDLPKGAVSILPGSSDAAAQLLEDERVKLITFTGSDTVGWWIKDHSGKKKVVLELGGNAGAIVADDADLAYAVERLVFGSFAHAGQSCISVQRILVHESIFERFLKQFVARTKKLKVGDPLDPATDVGAMVSREAAETAEHMVAEAVKAGARVLTGGRRNDAVLQPTVLTNVTNRMAVCAKEVFAPVVTVSAYRTFSEAVETVNDSVFGLQAGVFTNRLSDVFHAFKYIDTGGVVVNDVPTFRADHQPYGGVKNSGLGREGVRYAIEDMTEVKILSMSLRQ